MTKPIHDDLIRYFDGVLATNIGSIEHAFWRTEHKDTNREWWSVEERRLLRDDFMKRRARIGMGLHWMRREGWAEVVMYQHADGPHPYWRLTRKGRAELRRRKRADP